jgi:hypothetical protein
MAQGVAPRLSLDLLGSRPDAVVSIPSIGFDLSK